MISLESRESLADLANAMGLTTAVEVGTHQAVFARAFMQRFRGTITLVDPWSGNCPLHGEFFPNEVAGNLDRDKDYEIAMNAMSRFKGRVSALRMPSVEAVNHFKDRSIGIVYLDGMHDKEHIEEDIALWHPKVMNGGILSGHDYHFLLPDVCDAVDRFASAAKYEVNRIRDHRDSWWVIVK